MTEVLSGVLMFTLVVLALVGLLLAARRQLVPSGDVTISINDDPSLALKVPAGNTLLGTLGEQPRLAARALERRRLASFGAVACYVPSVEDELLVHTLRFMYGRPALRLGDAAWLLGLDPDAVDAALEKANR